MTKIAVLSDVHGNLMALQEAEREIQSWGPDRIWFLGDAVVFGPDPEPCLEILTDSLGAEILIEGNTDRYLREESWRELIAAGRTGDRAYPLAQALAYADRAIGEEGRRILRSMQHDIRVQVDGVTFLLCHGAPGDDEFRMAADEDPLELDRRVEAVDADVILCGHTHIPWRTTIGGVKVINDGSVGYPFDGDVRGAWAALEVAAGREVRVELRRFDYDREETIRRLREVAGDMVDVLVRRLRTGRSRARRQAGC